MARSSRGCIGSLVFRAALPLMLLLPMQAAFGLVDEGDRPQRCADDEAATAANEQKAADDARPDEEIARDRAECKKAAEADAGKSTASGRYLRPWEDPSVPHEMGTPKHLRPEEPPPDGPRLVGCFKDTQPFDLDGHLEAGKGNTPQACASKCASLGFRYAGVQNGQSCLCGNSYGRYGPADNCNLPCTGDGAQVCGGGGANSVYETGVGGGGNESR